MSGQFPRISGLSANSLTLTGEPISIKTSTTEPHQVQSIYLSIFLSAFFLLRYPLHQWTACDKKRYMRHAVNKTGNPLSSAQKPNVTECTVCLLFHKLPTHFMCTDYIAWGRCGRLTVKANSHTACRAHAVPLPCRAAKGLECVFPI